MMKCVLCNARSIVNIVDCLNLLEQTFCVDIILLTETWLDSTIPDSLLISQNNFRCFRKDRDRCGGGVSLNRTSLLPLSLYQISTAHLRWLH